MNENDQSCLIAGTDLKATNSPGINLDLHVVPDEVSIKIVQQQSRCEESKPVSASRLSRHSSTFSNKSQKSHFSMRSGVLARALANNESAAESRNPSTKRVFHFQHTQANLDSITSATSNNMNNNRLNTFDAVSEMASSSSNRSISSINPIAAGAAAAAASAATNMRASISAIETLSNIIDIKDPVVIRGAGNITIFGVSNKFCEQFPTQLNAKLAPEEFRDTIKQINSILSRELANSFRWLVFGSIFCCCTLGCSLLPVIFMNKKARLSINKLLALENQRLYLKLGLKWKLTKIKCNSNSLMEYVLLIEFLPTVLLYQPD